MKSTFFCIDGHTCGNPVRLVAGGAPILPGKTMAEKRLYFMEHYDWIRQGLMYEPRGHDMMSGSFLYPPSNPDNDFGIIFIETSGCLPMCGHGSIGTITMALQEGLVTPKVAGKLKMETPAGLVEVTYRQEGTKVLEVSLVNVPSFLAAEDLKVYSDILKAELSFDLAYGGNFYAIFDPQKSFSGIQDFSASQLIALSQEVRPRINEHYNDLAVHPLHNEINGVKHLMWTGNVIDPDSTARNAVFYGDKAIDRSPCGTGTSARLAQWAAKGMLDIGEDFIHESIIGSKFKAQIVDRVNVGDFQAIVPMVSGWAKQYGYNTISIDLEEDPFAHGFQVI
ncbi:4-hydroxyproline epimerase [Flavobacteriaceae bacterium]|nr:4-hydroxyproline epimerase [Flavobacteriaceae bacterium]